MEAEPGYSRELVATTLDKKYYDDLEGQPPYHPGCFTFLDYFEKNVRERRDDPFLGQRPSLGNKEFGEYQWKSFGEIEKIAQKIARGMKVLDLVT